MGCLKCGYLNISLDSRIYSICIMETSLKKLTLKLKFYNHESVL
ncbi:MAG: hypothetical protein ACLSV2_02420 [Clostridium sp.]